MEELKKKILQEQTTCSVYAFVVSTIGSVDQLVQMLQHLCLCVCVKSQNTHLTSDGSNEVTATASEYIKFSFWATCSLHCTEIQVFLPH